MKEIKAIIRPERLPDVLKALHEMPELPGVTVSHVRGFGKRVPRDDSEPFAAIDMTKLEIVVSSTTAPKVVAVIRRAAHTGGAGDGNIFMSTVDEALKIRSGERNLDAL